MARNSQLINTARLSKDKQMHEMKIPPHSIDAEQSVLGGVMLDNDRWDDVSERLDVQDFYNHAHRLIYKEMFNLFQQQKPIDLITVSDALEQQEHLDEVGGFAYLAELSKNTPSVANIAAYAEVVHERAIVRALIGVAHDIADAGYKSKGRDSSELLDLAESKVFNIAESRSSRTDSPLSVEQVLNATVSRIEQLSNNPFNGVTGIPTGFTDLDKKTAGLQKSDLIIVAARPSMGKTTFAMNLCEHAAMTQDKPVLVFSLEMPNEQLMMRTLSSLSSVGQTKVRTGQLCDEDWARISSTMGLLLEKQNLYIDDSSGLTTMEIRSRARRIYREHGGLSLIMIDYLQLMRGSGRTENRTLEIAEISRSLKALAKELEVPVVALSQLNRSLEQRADKRPINSDLRESGSIEQDADLIMFIYRDEVYNSNSDEQGMAEIIIGKQRNGPIGRVKLSFQGQFSRFGNYTGLQYVEE